jgi:vacuolar protein sorting-associated protein 16
MEVTWCGDDAVVLLWKNTGIVMVGPYGDWLNYPYEGTVTVISELDCCRIITSTSCEILQRVPPSTEAIRRIGSTDPAALLFDAMEGYLEGDPKSDDNIRSIALTNQLQYAVKSCISAAAAEFDILKQQSLFRAASYGKAFCQNFDSNEFVEIGQRLRVLNDIRRPEIGLPLTIQEYTRLTPEVLVNRLTLRNHHFLAIKICELLKLPKESVLIHWASEKVKKLSAAPSSSSSSSPSVSDEEITALITTKLRPYPRISYLDIAAAAYQMGRRKLATMLLELESNPSDQVPLLLSMNEVELALQKAITSDDSDLIYLTLIHLERSEPNPEIFYRIISQHSEALNLLKIYYQNKSTPSSSATAGGGGTEPDHKAVLMRFYQFQRNYYEAGLLSLSSAWCGSTSSSLTSSDSSTSPLTPPLRLQVMKEAIQIFHQSKDLSLYKQFTEEEVELIQFQQLLELRSNNSRDFTQMSISETLENIYILSVEHEAEVMRWNQEASKLIKQFKVSDKMVWHIRINCYCKYGQWDYLWKLANEKRSPIGYKPFALACHK